MSAPSPSVSSSEKAVESDCLKNCRRVSVQLLLLENWAVSPLPETRRYNSRDGRGGGCRRGKDKIFGRITGGVKFTRWIKEESRLLGIGGQTDRIYAQYYGWAGRGGGGWRDGSLTYLRYLIIYRMKDVLHFFSKISIMTTDRWLPMQGGKLELGVNGTMNFTRINLSCWIRIQI